MKKMEFYKLNTLLFFDITTIKTNTFFILWKNFFVPLPNYSASIFLSQSFTALFTSLSMTKRWLPKCILSWENKWKSMEIRLNYLSNLSGWSKILNLNLVSRSRVFLAECGRALSWNNKCFLVKRPGRLFLMTNNKPFECSYNYYYRFHIVLCGFKLHFILLQ